MSQLELNNESLNSIKTYAAITPAIKRKANYKNPDSKEQNRATVIIQAGKATVKNRYWFNIKDLDDNKMKSSGADNISSWKTLKKNHLQNHLKAFNNFKNKQKGA